MNSKKNRAKRSVTVVMGGSFNPPTVAHLRLLLAAVEELGAGRGVFVPSSQEYVLKKMEKSGAKDAVIPEKIRFEMLSAMAEEDPRLTADGLEFHRTEKAYTFETLVDISEKYPEDEIYFLAGGDKVDIFPRWHRIEEFLDRFRIITVKRAGDDPAQEIKNNAFLAARSHRFYIMDAPDGLEGISSSAVRAAMKAGRTAEARSMCHPRVFEMLCRSKDPAFGVICGFFGQYRFLSNFWESPVEYGGTVYSNNEAAFQAQKCLSNEERLAFAELAPEKAKALGRTVRLRADWESVKIGIMEEIVFAKFSQSPKLAALLLATGDVPLIEGNDWGDTFWGADLHTFEGENYLGQCLIKARARLREMA